MGESSESILTSLEPQKGYVLACSCLRDIKRTKFVTALTMMEAESPNCHPLMDKKRKLRLTFASHGALIRGRESCSNFS